eukprot:5392643-Prymnesium_polylepis.1
MLTLAPAHHGGAPRKGKAFFRTCPRGAADFRRGSLGCENGNSCDQAYRLLLSNASRTGGWTLFDAWKQTDALFEYKQRCLASAAANQTAAG